MASSMLTSDFMTAIQATLPVATEAADAVIPRRSQGHNQPFDKLK